VTLKISSLVLAAAVSLAATASAQDLNDPFKLRVDVTPSTPDIAYVILRDANAIFMTSVTSDPAYFYDRTQHRFTRGAAERGSDVPHSDNARSIPDLHLADSLVLQAIIIGDNLRTAIINDGRARTIALRGPRVTAEKQWRRMRGMRETPAPPEDDDYRHLYVQDWGPVFPLSYAVDDNAVWVGLEHSDFYKELALGGMLRIDRKSRRVSTVTDSLVMHASVSQIEPAEDGFLLIADGRVLRFDARTMRAVDTRWSDEAMELRVAGDTVFIAGRGSITIASLKSGKAIHKGFQLTVANDSVTYEVVEKTPDTSYDTLAILGVAQRLNIRKLNEWMKAARGKVRATALEFYYSGNNFSNFVPIEFLDSTMVDNAETIGPNAIMAEGFEHPSLRPFLRQALLEPDAAYSQLDIARILLSVNDTAATPFLRVALANRKDSYAAVLAKTLALLGDTVGNRWIRAALLDTTRDSATPADGDRIHSYTFEAAGAVRDPQNVSHLLDLSVDPQYGPRATAALLEYQSAEIAQELLSRISHQDSMITLEGFMRRMAEDTTFPMPPTLRDSVAAAATALLHASDDRWRTTAVAALAQHARPVDLPAIIGSLTLDKYTYGAAVFALVELTGTGVDAMPKGYGSDADRAAAQRWWSSWYESHRNDLRLRSKAETLVEAAAMRRKLGGY
jgi:hypothetical protein